MSTAASFCMFDKKLRSSGKSSIIWGVLNLIIGGGLMAANDRWGAISVLLGLALIVAGFYERKVRDPRVILISAGTLAGLALWNFALIGLAATGRVQLALGGRTLFWAIAQAWGAYSTWTTYSTYKMLRELSDPATVEQVRGYMDELNQAKPAQTLDMAEFEANAGFVEGAHRYRLKPIEDLYLVAKYKSQLGSLQFQELSFVRRGEVSINVEGEKWMSKKIKATIQLGPLKLNKVSISPEMAERLDPTARAILLGRT